MRTGTEARRKLFRAIVIVGASVGATGCPEHGKSPNPDAKPIVDAFKPPPPDAAMADVILII